MAAVDRVGSDTELPNALERGELLRTAGDFAASITIWRAAAEQFRQLDENSSTIDQWLDTSSKFAVNDKAARYQGHAFERVLLASRLALNYVAQGRWDEARIEIRRSHELEARIAEQQSRRQQKVEEAAKARGGWMPSWTELGGYPVEVVDSPQVRALRNSYQSAFSHYLAGFVYEALGENSLAAAGYRTAIELQGAVPVLEDGLRELDRRSHLQDGLVDTLMVVEEGWTPARVPVNFVLNGVYLHSAGYRSPRLVNISFPVLQQDGMLTDPDGWTLGGMPVEFDLVTDTGLMARRALRDDMPGIILRTVVRAIARQAVSDALDKQADGKNRAAFFLASTLVQVGGAIMEQADDRSWRTLPARFYLARLRLPPGRQTLAAPGLPPVDIDIGPVGRPQLVVLRWFGQRLIRIQ